MKLALSAIQEGRIPAQRIYYINSDESVADAAAKIELFAEYGAHTLITFNRSFELALKWNIPGAELNPVKAVPRIRFNNKREKYLTNAEASRLLAACKESLNPQLKSIVQLLLLTGARKNELLQARWAHIDFERCSWLIPDSKTGKPRYVPLSTEAMAVIEQLPRFGGCQWLLPNPRTKLPFTDIKHPWENHHRWRNEYEVLYRRLSG